MNGPKIIFTLPFLNIRITESIVNMWIVMVVAVAVSMWLTNGLKVRNPSRKQIAVEKVYLMLCNMVKDAMDEKYLYFVPYIGTLFLLSIAGSLLSLVTLRPYTADLSVILTWTLVTFFLIQANNIKHNGVVGWLKSFTEPVAFITPLNIISEIANPVSMTFRHFGNIAAGLVITSLMYDGLAFLSQQIMPVGIPILQIGIPAVLSVYFDLFTSFLQAYIICMLTMVFIKSSG